jgi:diadenosine tetraphosphatase ApaH/serine/threonine PP2A family protein phosphatase
MPDNFEGPLAIISDIHGNLDALATVLKDIAANRCRAMVCLGDIVGYGPEPGACVKLVREYASAAVVGNHEAMFLAILREGPSDRETTNGLWKSLALGRKGLTAADTKWVRKLPLAAIARDMTFVHSSLHHPHKFDDIYNIESARLNFDAQETPISFHGHTHIPLVWEEKDGEVTGYRPGEGRIQLDRTHRYAVGVGSVGQPRDHDPRASYALYEPESHRLSIRRLEYDIERAQARFRKRSLTGFHHERIAEGE